MTNNRALTIIALMGALATGTAAACSSSTPARLGAGTTGEGGDDSSGFENGPGPSTSGVGGAGGHAATVGTGAGGCTSAADCDDNLPCTTDTCSGGVCEHAAVMCPQAQLCDAVKGCVPAMACSSTAQCVAALGSDACKADILCDPAQSICTYKVLDKDGDGYPPVVCGGTDCDDSNPAVHPGAPEICDGKDNDCNGQIDDGATCGGMMICQAGSCGCLPANMCGADCVDLTTDPDHCGSCNNVCQAAQSCVGSTCVCGPNATKCNGQCVDIQSDPQNCNGCGLKCAAGATCQSGSCVCGGGLELCNGVCSNTQTDPVNCGFCNNPCPGNETCVNGSCANSLFTFSGIQTNLPISSLTGWTQCYLDNYGTTQTLASITSACTQTNMLLACRPAGSATLTLAAYAPRTDVMFDVGTGNVTHNANGVGWYFNNAWSWGFAPQGDTVLRNKCDETASSLSPAGVDGNLRLCWHTITAGSITPGWRCGSTDAIVGATYERLIFQAP